MKASKQQLKRLGKRGLSLFMAMTMCLSLIQISAFATDPTQAAKDEQADEQITHAGDTNYYDIDGSSVDVDSLSAGAVVSVSKTVNPTGVENKFQIHLEVKTTQDLHEISLSPDAAVVLVMDVSNSMVGRNAMETIGGVEKERLSWAKDAADTFLTNYVQDSGQAKRMVSVVEFGSNAKTVLPWTEANSKTQDSNDNTIVSETAVSGIAAVDNGFFTYYDCNQTGTHTHTEWSTDSDWNWGWVQTGPNYWDVEHLPTTCKVCGMEYERYSKYSDNYDHQHQVTYNGPHGENYDNGGTNIEGGLMLARNLIQAGQQSGGKIEGIENLYVILLTDGVPTYNVSDGDASTTEVSYISGTQGGASYATYEDAKDVPALAKDIKNASGASNPIQYGAKLYSLVYGNITNQIPVSSETYSSGQHKGEYKYTKPINDWLINTVQVDHNYASSTGGDIGTNLGSIGAIIGTVTHAWLVTDSMPANGMVSFSDGNLSANGGTFSDSNSSYLHYWDSGNNQLIWDLKQETPTKSGSVFTYTLNYDVILNTEHPAFVPDTNYATNEAATLDYLVLDASESLEDLTPAEVTARIHSGTFDTPTVHGYLGEFDFMKIAHHRGVDSENNPVIIPLAGAPFQLTNSANAPLYVPANAITKDATSQPDAVNKTLGQVEFIGIPSGYDYTLSETGEFTYNGRTYQPINTPWLVHVNYGEISGAPSGNVENMLKQIPENLTLTKTWNLAPGSSTQEITVYLYQDNSKSPFATLTLNGDDYDDGSNPDISITPIHITGTQWQYQLTVPSINQESGGNYSYRIEEASLNGIRSVVDGMNITNTTTGITSVSVEKKWALIDGQDPSASMPDVEVFLTRTTTPNGTGEAVGSVTLGKGPDKSWNYEWNNLPAYDNNGQPYTYAVTEGQGNYQDIKVVPNGNHFTLYNRVLEGETTKTVTKTWNDENPNDRPDITVELMRDDNTPYSYTMSANDETGGTVISGDGKTWSHTFTDLPQYQIIEDDSQPSGVRVHEYVYTVAELTDVPGYTSTTSGNLGLINTRAQNVSIQVEKTWDDKVYNFDHGEVTIQLRGGPEIYTATTDNGVATFSDLPQFNPATGEAYDYTVLEENVPAGYIDSYNYGADSQVVVFDDGSHIGTVTVTNTLTTKDDEKTSVHVSKVWQQPSGTTAPSVTFTLAQLDKDGNSVNLNYASYEMTSGSSYTFANLPMYYYKQVPETHMDPETNQPTTETVVKEYMYQYTVSESAIDGYNNGQPATPAKIDDNDWQFTNTRTGTVDLTVNKVWNDIDDSTRSDATITLQRASAVENGALTFENVQGADPLVTKGNDSKTWTVDQFDGAGQPYIYRVLENTVPSYSTTYTADTYSDTVQSITVTNTLMPVSNYSFNASKTWMDNSNAANTREDITLTLLRNNEAQGTVVIGANGTLGTGTYTGNVSVTPDQDNSNKWTISFTGLEKYYIDSSDGKVKQYTYSVAETLKADSAYVQNNGSTDIVNTLKQIGISIPLQKIWVDPETTEHTNSVTFSLTATNAGGQTVPSVGGSSLPTGVTLGFNPGDTLPQNMDGIDLTTDDRTVDNWYYTFTDLPQYDDNQSKITYTVAETSNLDGYTKEKADGSNLFTNTIVQEYLDFDGQKVWNMAAQSENDDDYLKPGPQPVTIGLYALNDDGSLGQRVTMGGLTNPVTVTPVTGTDTGTFSFQNLPKYDSNGSELHYTVREILVTTNAETGEPGYTPIPDGGTLQLTVSDHNNDFDYNYTVVYSESPKTPTENENNGKDTTVTNTYQDPNVYFYRIIGNYYTYLSGELIQSQTGVNLSGTPEGYVIGNADESFKAATGDYASLNGLAFQYDDGNENNIDSVSLDQENHMYTIVLNYERNLYSLSVNYVFENVDDKPAKGFENYTAPNWTAPGEGQTYTDPGNYLPGDTYSGISKAAPAGFKITQVTVEDATGTSTVNNYDGGTFADHNVIVTYYYAKVVNPVDSVTDAHFTIQKIDSATKTAITSSAADFQVYTGAGCTDEDKVDGKVFSTSTVSGPDAGTVTVNASDLGEGTWYLKESKAPTGYTASDTVWKAVVTRTTSQDLEDGQYVNNVVWTVAVTLNDENALIGEGNDLLVVPNTRQTGFLTITKTVSGLPQDDVAHTFKFTVTGTDYTAEHSITVTGSGTESLQAIEVPTGNYTITEDSSSAHIGSGYSCTTVFSGENGANSVAVTANHTFEAPANITVTNTYQYTPNGVTISGQKVWDDDNNRDGLRPDSIRLQLFYNGDPILGKTYNVLTNGNGAYEFKYDRIPYPDSITVNEVGYTDANGYHEGWIPGYDVFYGTDNNPYTITNTHTPEEVRIEASKVWNSGTQQPVTLRLQANGQAVEGAVMTLDGKVDEQYTPKFAAMIGSMDEAYASEFAEWTGNFPGTLYKYANGKLIDYSVTEDSLGGNWSYTTSKETRADGDYIYGYAFTVTNSYSSGGGGGDSSSYYYRTDYVYTGYGADGSQIYNDSVTGSVQTTGSSSYSFTAPDSANHGGYSFSLTSDADQNASLTGTSRSDPYVFTVYYEFNDLTDEETPTGETPDNGTTPDQPTDDIDIPEDAVPKADVPATGDNLALWIMAAAVSGVGLVWLSLTGKKRRDDENS